MSRHYDVWHVLVHREINALSTCHGSHQSRTLHTYHDVPSRETSDQACRPSLIYFHTHRKLWVTINGCQDLEKTKRRTKIAKKTPRPHRKDQKGEIKKRKKNNKEEGRKIPRTQSQNKEGKKRKKRWDNKNHKKEKRNYGVHTHYRWERRRPAEYRSAGW